MAPAASATAGPGLNAAVAVDDGRPRAWTTEELLPYIDDFGPDRSFQEGLKLFTNLACGVCHSFGRHSQGGGLSPDLTPVSVKLSRDVVLQSILEPSFEVDDRFYATVFRLKNGRQVEGSVVHSTDGKIGIVPSVMAPRTVVELRESDIESSAPSKVSQMPAGMLDGLRRDQILDLLAFLESAGEPDAAVYRK